MEKTVGSAIGALLGLSALALIFYVDALADADCAKKGGVDVRGICVKKEMVLQ